MEKLIILSDFYEIRKQKQEELAYYKAELERLQMKMMLVQGEIRLTNTIIDMITREEIIDIDKLIRDRGL